MARKPSTLSAYKPTLREQLAILGEKGYTALTGNEPGYEARDLINRYTGLADLLDVPGIALSASDAARSIGTRQYPQAAADVAGLALGAIPIAGPALKGAGKKVVKEGVEAATRLAAKYGAELNAPLRTAATPSIVRSAPTPAEYIEKGSEKHTYVEPSTGSHMSIVTRPTGPRSASVIDLQVPEEHRGAGIGKALQAAVLKDFPSLGGQVSSKAAAKNAYTAGRRMAGNEGASLDDIYKAIDENSSVNLWTPTVEDLASKYGAEADLPANYAPHGSPEYQANLNRLLEGNHPLVPPVLYHGTDRDIQVFDTEKRRREDAGMGANNTDTGWFGKGHYLTPKRGTAAYYAGKDIGANVMPVHASMKNPFVVQGTGGMDMDRAISAQYPDAPPTPQQGRKPSEQTAFLKSKGHDGVVALDPEGYHEFVAFDSPQIKSAIGNRGTFDPNEPDITKARGGVVNSADLRYKYGIK